MVRELLFAYFIESTALTGSGHILATASNGLFRSMAVELTGDSNFKNEPAGENFCTYQAQFGQEV